MENVMNSQQAEFVIRNKCINCGSKHLNVLSSGSFNEEPIRTFIEDDPWGESPLPYLENERWVYVQCNECSQMFHSRILSPEWNEILFSKWMTEDAILSYEEKLNTPLRQFEKKKIYVEHVLRIEKKTRKIRENESVRILDFGCGWGEFLAMCERFDFTVYGVDKSSARREAGQNVPILPRLDDIKQTKEGSLGFHAITLFEVLEHLDDPFSILQELSEYLVRDGILVLETPNCTGTIGITSKTDYRHIHPLSHINGFTPETLRSIAERAGFRSVKRDIAQVTCDGYRVAKREMKRLFSGILKPTTQQYFRKI